MAAAAAAAPKPASLLPSHPTCGDAASPKCTLCHQALFGASVACARCGAIDHAQCAGVSAQEALRRRPYACANCQAKSLKRQGEASRSGGNGGNAGNADNPPKRGRATKAPRANPAALAQNLLSLV